MRDAWSRVPGQRPFLFGVAAGALLCACLVEGTGSKTVDAIASAAMAGAATVEVEREKAAARNAAWGPERDDGCPMWACYAGSDMTLDEARAYAVLYINHARAEAGVGALVLDFRLSAFAQSGSKELSRDHVLHRHILSGSAECPSCAENQSDPQGVSAGPVHDQLNAVLASMLAEGPGGANHDVLLDPHWHRLGIGIVNPTGVSYVTIDLAP
jgi:hypothetical protein